MHAVAEETRCKFLLSVVLFFKVLFTGAVIVYAGIGLGPDEAQYWTWSQQLDFGYYSKPPAIAWVIWLGTQAFGNTEWGVRAAPLLMGTLLPLAVYQLARAIPLTPAASLISALAIALSPLGMMASLLAITDGGMVLAWTYALWLLAKRLQRPVKAADSKNWMYALGAVIGFGALFKWTMYEFWAVVAVLMIFVPSWRSWHMVGAVAVSLLGLAPSLYWNAQNDWATFRHVGATIWTQNEIDVGTTALMRGNLLDFLGAQMVLISPVLFFLLIAGGIQVLRRRGSLSPALLLCAGVTFAYLGAYSLAAIFKKMQGNWADFAYPSAAIIIGWYSWDVKKNLHRTALGGLCLSCALLLFAFFIPALQSHNVLSIPYKINPFRQNVGWRSLQPALAKAGYSPKENFLFSDKYQTTSLLSFYGEWQKRAYFFNLQGLRKNQFSYWPSAADNEQGKTGYFVVLENVLATDPKWLQMQKDYKEQLAPYFQSVHFESLYPLFFANGLPVKNMMIFRCEGYTGQQPLVKEKY